MLDLTRQITNWPWGTGFTCLYYARAINQKGWIAGYDNRGHPFRLIPDNDPPVGQITINGGAGYSGSLPLINFPLPPIYPGASFPTR
jgi:hypothetical protein